MSIDQKSGWNTRSKNTTQTIEKKGIKPLYKSESSDRFFFIKYASTRISHIFTNSTGWSEKGTQGISIHHRAPLYFDPIKSTIKRNKSVVQNILFAYLSKNV